MLALPVQTSWTAVLSAGDGVALRLLVLVLVLVLVLAMAVLGLNALFSRLHRRVVGVSAGPEKLAATFGPEADSGIVIVFVLAFGSLSESLGLHFVIGAFFGSLLLDKSQFAAVRYEELRRTLSSITGGFHARGFFACLGLEFQLSALAGFGFVAAVLTAAIASKVWAGWRGGCAIGLFRREALGFCASFSMGAARWSG